MLDWSVPRETCWLDRLDQNGASFRASGFPRPIPGVPPEKNLKGLSFAVANVTGIVARIIADGPAGDPVTAVTRAFERGSLPRSVVSVIPRGLVAPQRVSGSAASAAAAGSTQCWRRPAQQRDAADRDRIARAVLNQHCRDSNNGRKEARATPR